jgi:PAS domain S-box-containing protein
LDTWQRARLDRVRYDDEYRMVGAGGRIVWIRDTAAPVPEPSGQRLVWHGAMMDVTDRVEAAERLRASEESKRALLEQIPALVYIQHDLNRSTVLNTGGLPELLGYSTGDWADPDRAWADSVHPDDLERVTQTWVACYAERRPFAMQYRVVGRNGKVVWIRDRAAPMSGSDWHGITFDITDLVETAERLRETQSRYQSLIEQIPVVTYLDDLSGSSIYVSPQVEEMLGVPMERWLDDGYGAWVSCIHPDDVGPVDARYRQMLEEGAGFDAEYRVVLPGGEVRWVHDQARPIVGASGRPTVVQGVIVDVTDRRLVAHSTEQQAQRQRAVAELGLRALEGLQAEALFNAAAREVMETLGASAAAVLRAEGDDLLLVGASGLVEDEPRCLSTHIRGGSAAGQAMLRDEPVICSDFRTENRFRVAQMVHDLGMRSCACVKISGFDGPYGVLGVYGDRPAVFGQDAIDFLLAIANVLATAIERQRVEEALERSEAQRRRVLSELLRSADAERARIATELHDDTIQVMTAALIGLDRQASSEKRGDRPAADRAARLAREMLAEAVDRTRRMTFELRPPLLQARGLEVAVRELVDESARAAGFTAQLDATIGRQPAEVESLCYRTVQELVANARKHSSARRLDVRLWQEDGRLAAEVVDDGVGFDVARALDRSITRLHLGLDSAAEQIRLAGGELLIDSEPGRGTRICFSIPT